MFSIVILLDFLPKKDQPLSVIPEPVSLVKRETAILKYRSPMSLAEYSEPS